MSYLTTPLGNNSISYHERKALGSDTRLRLPEIRTITSIDDVQLGSDIVFEEIDHHGQLQSFTGLAALYKVSPPEKGEGPACGRGFWIMDNHNYALFARSHIQRLKTNDQRPIVIHIDAHADLDQPLRPKQHDEDRRTYTTEGTSVGSFIQPALATGLISECIQIRSYYALEQLATRNGPLDTTIILDIDLDFRAHEPSIPDHHLRVLQDIIASARASGSLATITIATSPYFLDQHKAMHFLQQLKPILQ